jgi:hypothetical protein
MMASADQSEIHYGLRVVRGVLEENKDHPIAASFVQAFPKTGLWWGIWKTHLCTRGVFLQVKWRLDSVAWLQPHGWGRNQRHIC